MTGDHQSGREERFERLYRSFAVDVLAYCRRRVPPEAADDALAETFLVAWRRLDEVPDEARGWLLGVARRVLSNQRRASRRQGAVVERLIIQRPLSAAASEARPSAVLDALAELTSSDQETLLLAAWDGLTSEEAAQVLGCSAVAFRLRLHRARRRLARLLGSSEAPPMVRLQPEEET